MQRRPSTGNERTNAGTDFERITDAAYLITDTAQIGLRRVFADASNQSYGRRTLKTKPLQRRDGLGWAGALSLLLQQVNAGSLEASTISPEKRIQSIQLVRPLFCYCHR